MSYQRKHCLSHPVHFFECMFFWDCRKSYSKIAHGGKSKGQNPLLEGAVHENVNDGVVAEAVFLSYESSCLSHAESSVQLLYSECVSLQHTGIDVKFQHMNHLVIIVKNETCTSHHC